LARQIPSRKGRDFSCFIFAIFLAFCFFAARFLVEGYGNPGVRMDRLLRFVVVKVAIAVPSDFISRLAWKFFFPILKVFLAIPLWRATVRA